jgi:hypothetical protein
MQTGSNRITLNFALLLDRCALTNIIRFSGVSAASLLHREICCISCISPASLLHLSCISPCSERCRRDAGDAADLSVQQRCSRDAAETVCVCLQISQLSAASRDSLHLSLQQRCAASLPAAEMGIQSLRLERTA